MLSPAAGATAAVTSVRLTRSVGPPTTHTRVKGQGFGPSEGIDIAFDGSDIAHATSDPGGRFLKGVTVPVAALPGPHAVVATGESSGLTAQATFTVRTDWPQFHYDPTLSGSNPYENVVNPSNVAGLTVDWSVKSPGYVNTAPVVVGGTVYVGVSGVGGNAWTMAVDAATGKQLWFKHSYAASTSDLAVWNGTVYQSGLDHTLHAYNARTGTELWSTPGPTASPSISGGVVYAGDDYSDVYAIDATSGAVLWTATTTFNGGILSAPAVQAGVVYVGTVDPGAGADTLIAFDSLTGSRIWGTPVGVVYGSPTISKGIIYVGSGDGHVYAVDPATGSVLWAAATDYGVGTTPTVGGSTVYATSGSVYAFKAADGTLLWRAPGTSPRSPIQANGVIYVGLEDSSMAAYDGSTGDPLWTFPLSNIPGTAPAISDGVVYTGSFDGFLYAFHLP